MTLEQRISEIQESVSKGYYERGMEDPAEDIEFLVAALRLVLKAMGPMGQARDMEVDWVLADLERLANEGSGE